MGAALVLAAACGQEAGRSPGADAGSAASAATACTPAGGHATYGTSCDSCHPCGARATSGHLPAWMDQASAGFHAYSANQGLASCQGCHGANLDGVGGVATTACAQCHGSAWKTTCTMCHGGTDNQTGAPPRAIWGKAAETVRVGAHTAHVEATHGLAAAVACAACHVAPADALAAGHIGGGTATVTWGGLAVAGGAAPAWDRVAGTCAGTYCHGATLTAAGGTNKAPVWTTVNGTQAACGTCHAIPPPAPHSTSAACGTCHSGYTSTTVNATLHIDGTIDAVSPHPAGWAAASQHGHGVNLTGLAGCKGCHGTNLDGVGGSAQSCGTCHAAAGIASWQTNCTFCHGDRTTGLASPPVDIQGRSVTANASVGVHAAHLGTALMTGMSCAQCHPDRTGSNVVTDAAHVDGNGIAEVAFGALAGTGGAAATYARTSDTGASCAATYCHGTFTGGTSATVSWTAPGKLSCSACHGAPPSTHSSGATNCASCHSSYTGSTVNAALHLDGAIDVLPLTCTSCHGNPGQTATAAAPLYAAPPLDAAGASTGIRVGAHQKHLLGGSYANGIGCQSCHASVGTYTTTHADGVSQVGFTGAGNANLRRGTWKAGTGTAAGSCSATWCHGAVINRTGGASGGTATAPSWTATITACTACHAVRIGSLPDGHREEEHSVPCSTCHGSGYTSTGTGSSRTGTGVDKPAHVDGVKTIVTVPTGTGIRRWDPATRTCYPSCHERERWEH